MHPTQHTTIGRPVTYEPDILRLHRRLRGAQAATAPSQPATADQILAALRDLARDQGDPWLSLTVLHRHLGLNGCALTPVEFVAAITALDRDGRLYLNPVNELPAEGFCAGTITARNSAGQTCLEAMPAPASAAPGSADFQSAPPPKREAPNPYPPAPTRNGALDYPQAPASTPNLTDLVVGAARTLAQLRR